MIKAEMPSVSCPLPPSTGVLIRPARLDDAEALQRYCYPDASVDDVRDYLAWCLRQARKGRLIRLVAEVEGQAVGNVQLTVWGREGEIGSLVVAEAFRRQGLARRLLTELIGEARRRGLEALEMCAAGQEAAILAFYQQLGFQPVPDTKKRLSRSISPGPVVHLRMELCGP